MSTFPDQAALSSAMELQVFDAKGQLVSFDSILPASGKTVVVFIRQCSSHAWATPVVAHAY